MEKQEKPATVPVLKGWPNPVRTGMYAQGETLFPFTGKQKT
jgi:hypothetical protein